MNVQLWWGFAEMDVASIASVDSDVIASQVTPRLLTKPDAEVSIMSITCH